MEGECSMDLAPKLSAKYKDRDSLTQDRTLALFVLFSTLEDTNKHPKRFRFRMSVLLPAFLLLQKIPWYKALLIHLLYK